MQYLMVDIGAGTMDVLCYDTDTDLHYKAVVKSPVRTIAEKAAAIPGDLIVTGCEMGGGPITGLLKQRAQEVEVVMTSSAAVTLHHNLEIVKSWGIKVVEDDQAEDFCRDKNYHSLILEDLEAERLRRIVEGFGVPFEFEAVVVCGQDHGVPPPGESHLDFRHNMFTDLLEKNPHPHTLLFEADEVPDALNRLRALAQSARSFPTAEVFVMDSGMAAMLGGSMDVLAKQKQHVLILDVATSHTVGAAMLGGELAGFFEYHTSDITLARLEQLMLDLCEGKLEHSQILREGGHGAFVRKSFGFDAVEVIIATGPRRRLVEGSRLSMEYGAPYGDNMMTGTVGLLEALRRRKGLAPINYI
ncbi:MAG: pyruvate formate-lyase activating enzyme [Proteobacteria bacterium]|nr:pyruvate formate-lyase activating enzyme [Pseudomonadota bacterium]